MMFCEYRVGQKHMLQKMVKQQEMCAQDQTKRLIKKDVSFQC